MVRIEFRNPEHPSRTLTKLAEFDIYFPLSMAESTVDELKIVGGSVVDGVHEVFVNLPARAFGIGPDRRYFEYIRDDDGGKVVKKFKAEIVRQYKAWKGSK